MRDGRYFVDGVTEWKGEESNLPDAKMEFVTKDLWNGVPSLWNQSYLFEPVLHLFKINGIKQLMFIKYTGIPLCTSTLLPVDCLSQTVSEASCFIKGRVTELEKVIAELRIPICSVSHFCNNLVLMKPV